MRRYSPDSMRVNPEIMKRVAEKKLERERAVFKRRLLIAGALTTALSGVGSYFVMRDTKSDHVKLAEYIDRKMLEMDPKREQVELESGIRADWFKDFDFNKLSVLNQKSDNFKNYEAVYAGLPDPVREYVESRGEYYFHSNKPGGELMILNEKEEVVSLTFSGNYYVGEFGFDLKVINSNGENVAEWKIESHRANSFGFSQRKERNIKVFIKGSTYDYNLETRFFNDVSGEISFKESVGGESLSIYSGFCNSDSGFCDRALVDDGEKVDVFRGNSGNEVVLNNMEDDNLNYVIKIQGEKVFKGY